MKLLLSLFLSLQIVTNFTFFEDVVRIPFLIEHYIHHTEKETPNISFIDFIAMHYFTYTYQPPAPERGDQLTLGQYSTFL
jgi:hypothetical protein